MALQVAEVEVAAPLLSVACLQVAQVLVRVLVVGVGGAVGVGGEQVGEEGGKAPTVHSKSQAVCGAMKHCAWWLSG